MGNAIEWIAIKKGARVLLHTISRNAEIHDRKDREEEEFLLAVKRIFERRGAVCEIESTDILQSMWDDRRYDVILLNGVLERQKSQNMTEVKVLSLLGRHLLSHGRLYIIEQNRLGIEYLAGYPHNEHRGLLAPDMDAKGAGYTAGELRHIVKAAGFPVVRFYYPYDNDRETRAIYTKEWSPDGSEGYLVSFTKEKERLSILDEEDFYQTILNEGLLLHFVNAFLVECRMEESTEPRLIYAGYADDRKEEFALRTSIYSYSNGNLAVTKTPLFPAGSAHVSRMYDTFSLLSQYYKGYSLQIAPCAKMENGVGFSYLQGRRLTELIAEKAEAGDEYHTTWLIQRFIDVVSSPEKLSVLDQLLGKVRFSADERFVRIFGTLTDEEEDLIAGEEYLTHTDIVMNFDSVMVKDQTWTIFNYEWCVDFPVPFSYVVYCAVIHQFCERIAHPIDEEMAYHLLEHFGISKEKRELFLKMREAFVRYIGREVIEPEPDPGYLLDDLIALLPDKGASDELALRMDFADGTDDLRLIRPRQIEDNGRCFDTVSIQIEGIAAGIRLLLSEDGGILTDLDVRDDRGNSLLKKLSSNSAYQAGDTLFYTEGGAYIEIAPGKKARSVDIRYRWISVSEEAGEQMKKLIAAAQPVKRGLFK